MKISSLVPNRSGSPRNSNGRSLIFILLILFCLPVPAVAEVIHVPADVSTIQEGINAASDGDTVLVAVGTYTDAMDRNLDYHGKAITVTSVSGAEQCIIDCLGEGRGVNFHNDEDERSVFSGFTVRNGDTVSGGAVNCEYGASPTITDNIFTGNQTDSMGGAIMCVSASPLIRFNTIEDNHAQYQGGGIYCLESAPRIEYNIIRDNTAREGGGIHCWIAAPEITGNVISGNEAWIPGGRGGGGGIFSQVSEPVIVNNLIVLNTSNKQGGGLLIWGHLTPQMRSNTVAGNTASRGGGACIFSADLIIEDSIFWGNISSDGPEFYVGVIDFPGRLTLRYCDIEGGQEGITLGDGGELVWGEGMIDADPLFVTGPDGSYYLSQTYAGQGENSPCVDSGNPESDMAWGTTRTDLFQDIGIIDMGYHASCRDGESPDTWITAGPEGTVDSPVVVFTFTGEDQYDPAEALIYSHRLDDGDWSSYSSQTRATFTGLADGPHTFEVRAMNLFGYFDQIPAEREFTCTPWDESWRWGGLVTGPGPGAINPPLVRTSQGEWTAYGAMKYGVKTACGDLDGDGSDAIVTAPGPGLGLAAHIRGWTWDGTPLSNVNFFAYGTPKYGANVACGDIDTDGSDEIITGAGPGPVFGPHVRGWNVEVSGVSQVPGVSFFAYGTHKYGVNVTCGDIDGDGTDEIVTGAGPGAVFGPHVRGWKYDGVGATTPIPGISFLAYGTYKYGVNVACGDIDGDGIAEIITGPGPGFRFGAHVRAWHFDGSDVGQVPGISYLAYPGRFGVVVGAGDMDADGIDEILTMPGPGEIYPVHVRGWDAHDGIPALIESVDFLAYDDWITGGGTVSWGRPDSARGAGPDRGPVSANR